MSKSVIINLGSGDLENGFPAVTARLWEAGTPLSEQVTGSLPLALELAELYSQWQEFYRALCCRYPMRSPETADAEFEIEEGGITNVSVEDFRDLCYDLEVRLNAWLKSDGFLKIDRKLRSALSRDEDVRVIFETDNSLLRRLPWHCWEFFKDYPQAEMALSRPEFKRRDRPKSKSPRKQVRILAVLGNSRHIQMEIESEFLNSLEEARTTFLVQPSRQELNEKLWEDEGWDILFFAGHSETQGETGRLYINDELHHNSLTVEELEHALERAIACGLKLAIFNSCDGLGLATALAKLDIPQVIVMREPVANGVAQAFFRYFLEAFARKHRSLYLAVREARQKLQGLEDEFPGASWLPVICQNPAATPPSWCDLAIARCPYRGLSAFREEHAAFFFGRERFAQLLVSAVKRQSLVAVVGASGSGKSSVVFAGLIPRLRKQGTWDIVCFRPGKRPFESLAAAVSSLVKDRDVSELAGELQKTENALQEIVEAQPESRRLLLVADRFEELYTLCRDDDQRQQFLDGLLRAVEDAAAFTLVITLRADFFGHALSYRRFADALQDSCLHLGPMKREELQEAIALPAKKLNVELEEGLTDLLIKELGVAEEDSRGMSSRLSGSNLPLLEFALEQLWYQQQERLLTHQAYRNIGGVQGAVGDRAEMAYKRLDEMQRQQARKLFVQLVQPGDGTEDTRRLATRAEVGEESWALVGPLASEEARLVVADRLSAEETVELVHEALIRGWGRLQRWMRGDREFRRWQEGLRGAMRLWQESGEDEEALLQGATLGKAEEWWEGRREELSRAERVFVQLSIWRREGLQQAEEERRGRELARERKARRAAQTTTGVAVVAAAVVSVLAFVANGMRLQAELRESAAVVKSRLPYRPLEGLVLAIGTTGKSRSFWNQLFLNRDVPGSVQSSLLSAIQIAKEENRFLAHEYYVDSAAFSPDGKYVVSGGEDATLRLWNLQGEPIGQPWRGHEDWVSSVAFSPDGKYVVSGSSDKTLRLWNLQGEPIGQPWRGHESGFNSVAFSPNGKYIVSVNNSFLSPGTLQLWNLQGEPIGQPWLGHEDDGVSSFAFSPDGKYIVSGGGDGTLRLWNLQGEPIGEPWRGHEYGINSVAFSPDGKYVVSGSYDKTLRLWNLQGEPIGQPWRGHESGVTSVAFSPDGKYIVSGSVDRTLHLWNREPIGQPWRGHQEIVTSVAFSPDGKYVVSGSHDKTLRLWNLQGELIGEPWRGHQGALISVAFSPDGQSIVSGSSDETLRLWNLQGELIGEPWSEHQGIVTSVAFSPDGQSIVSNSWRTLRLWNLQGEPIGQPWYGNEYEEVQSVAFSPNGNYIVSVGGDNTVRLWNLEGEPIGEPWRGHEDEVSSVAFSPDGKYVVSGSVGGTLHLWNLQGEFIGEPWRGHEGGVSSVTFSPDRKYVVSGSYDATLRLWNLQGEPIGEPWRGHEDGVTSVAFSPDGKYVVSGSFDNTLRLWKIGNWETWLEIGCNRLRHHPVLKDPQTPEAKEARKTCQRYVW